MEMKPGFGAFYAVGPGNWLGIITDSVMNLRRKVR